MKTDQEIAAEYDALLNTVTPSSGCVFTDLDVAPPKKVFKNGKLRALYFENGNIVEIVITH